MDFSDNNSSSVSVSLTCSSGAVTNSPRNASQASPAVFNISGASAGASCTASESVPAGYTANQSNCQNRAINSSCTIVNTLDSPQEEEVINEYGFEDGNSADWSLNGNVAIDGILAIGQYSLRHQKGATSVVSVSTAGFEDVSVTMHLNATSLKKNDRCFAEISTNGGGSWAAVVEIDKDNNGGNFIPGTVSPSGADDNLDLQLRFGLTAKSGAGYCYGDEVIVSGTPIVN
jgi:hypothetical protein